MPELVAIGCGPGDPELITIKAKKLIQKADVVVYSGSLIPPAILKLCKKGKLYDASGLVREEIFDILHKNAKKGKFEGRSAVGGFIWRRIIRDSRCITLRPGDYTKNPSRKI